MNDPDFRALAGPGPISAHATTVAFEGRALSLFGPSNAGKSGLAAQMITLGAKLVVDDLTVFSAGRDHVLVSAPAKAPSLIELRGLGIVAVDAAGPTQLCALVWLGPSQARLPDVETVPVCGRNVQLLRHPVDAALAAKLMLWLRAQKPGSE